MNILYLITKSNFGGAQRYVYDLATGAQKRGHDVVVAFGGNGILGEKLVAAGVRTIPLPGLERDVNPVADFRTFLRLLELFAEESPDVVHLNSSKVGALGALAARVWNGWSWIRKFIHRGGKPMRIIFTGHGWAFNEERGDFERFLIGMTHWLTIQLTHKSIAVSRKTREQIAALPFVWHKLVIIHNGVGKMDTISKKAALDELLGAKKDLLLKEHPMIIGTNAELHKNKGLSYAIEGIAQFKKQSSLAVLYLIIGEGEEHTHLDALITKLELNDSVVLVGYKENALSYLSAFDIFLFPSTTEAFPYAILEAGNVGLPIIATSVGGIPEVIDDMESGILIQSKNPGEVARALAFLIDNPQRRTELGEAIRVRINGRFSLEGMLDETLALYGVAEQKQGQ